MWDAVACFSAGSPLGAEHEPAKPTSNQYDPLMVRFNFTAA